MKNILYIGPYREFSGIGNASRQYLKALSMAGHNIMIKPLYNTFKPFPENLIDPDILDLETNILNSYDIVIQHVYPHQYCYDYRFAKNIGILHLDSINYHQNMLSYVELMDEVIVGSSFVANAIKLIDTNNKCNIRIIPEPIDFNIIKKYKQDNQRINSGSYSFYTIGDFIYKKNIEKIIHAYLLAFTEDDDVELIIKTNHNDMDNDALNQAIEYETEKIFKSLKINTKFKKPKIMVGHTDYKNILYIHNNCDCFINVSMGESFGYSTLEAMCFNNNIVVNSNIASAEIIDHKCGLFVGSKQVMTYDPNSPYFIYNTYNQKWYDVSVEDVMEKMILAFTEDDSTKKSRIEAQSEKIKKFTLDNISKLLVNI